MKTRTTKEIVDEYNKCKTFHNRRWILESEVKKFIDEKYPEKPIKCFAQAVRYGSSQTERRDVMERFGIKNG